MSTPVWFVKLLQKVYPSRFLLAKTTRVPLIRRIADYEPAVLRIYLGEED